MRRLKKKTTNNAVASTLVQPLGVSFSRKTEIVSSPASVSTTGRRPAWGLSPDRSPLDEGMSTSNDDSRLASVNGLLSIISNGVASGDVRLNSCAAAGLSAADDAVAPDTGNTVAAAMASNPERAQELPSDAVMALS